MGGIFVSEGMGLRIPAGGFTIGVGEDGKLTSSITLEVALDVWPMWLDVAIEHAEAAQTARDELALIANGEEGTDAQAIGDLMTRECQASLVAVAASAFALENFHSGVLRRMPGASELREQEGDKPARVKEVLRRLIRPSNERTKELRTLITSIFRLRDDAVHASAELKALRVHDLLEKHVEWRLAQYTARIANTAVYSAAAVLMEACHREQAAPGVAEWCSARRERSRERFDRASLLEPRS
jgi:hypothetical protein